MSARKNSRQKRADKVRLAIHALGVARNPSTVASEGFLRSSTGFAKALIAGQVISSRTTPRPNDFTLETLGVKRRKSIKRWSITK